MSGAAAISLLTVLAVAGAMLAISGWMQPNPSLRRVIEDLRRPGPTGMSATGLGRRRVVSSLLVTAKRHPRLLPTDPQLVLAGRSLEQHLLQLVLAGLAGLIAPPLLIGVLQAAGVIGLGWFIPVAVALAAAVLAPLLVHTTTLERAAAVRTDLRYQVSAYLDMVTMLLAGNTGYEGALEQAGHAGDGRLFAELRRRMRESAARGLSLTDALERAGRELGLDELEQIAATAALSAAEGAPVARTLAAKCATLRTALSTEQESEARLRTSRLTTPIVGMALIFMGLVIYPALSFS